MKSVTFQYAPGANSVLTSTVYARVKVSEYHERCVPAEAKQAAQSSEPAAGGGTGKKLTETEKLRRDPVSYDRVWKQSVGHEKRGAQNWKESWGFMSEFDEKGEKKEVHELPEKVSVYSQNESNTNAGNYGKRVTTELGQAMQKMEFNFSSHNRRKKLDSDIVSY